MMLPRKQLELLLRVIGALEDSKRADDHKLVKEISEAFDIDCEVDLHNLAAAAGISRGKLEDDS